MVLARLSDVFLERFSLKAWRVQHSCLHCVKTQSLALHAFPAFVWLCEHSALWHAFMHTPKDLIKTSSFIVLRRKLRHRRVDDHIHLQVHDNSTDTQHHIAHAHVSTTSRTRTK